MSPLEAMQARPHRRQRQPAREVVPSLPLAIPDGVVVAFTAERGWHLTQSPPDWWWDASRPSKPRGMRLNGVRRALV